MKKRVLWGLVLFLSGTCVQSFAGTFYSFAAGDFSDRTKWSTVAPPAAQVVPSAAAWNNNPWEHTLTVTHAMTLGAASYTQWGAGPSVTINTGGSVTRTGSLTLTGSGINVITNGGTFEVTATLTIDNQSRVTMTSGTLKAGNLTLPANAASGVYYTAGTIQLTGSLSVGAAETFSYPPSLSIPGNLSLNNGSTITASNLGGTITLTNGSKLNLTGGTLSPSSISIAGANTELNIAGATVNYSSALSISGSSKLTVSTGTLAISNSLTIDGGIFSSASGTTTSTTSLTVSSSGTSQFTNGGTFNVTGSGNVAANGPITNNGTMNVGGDYNFGVSTTINNGTMNISGSVDIPSSSKFYTNPGGIATVNGNVTTRANQNLIVGTSVNPPPYADFVIKGNLLSRGSGDVLVDRNGRLAVFGNFDSNGGGAIFTMNDGAQVFVNGTIDVTGGGSHITNNNDGNPYYGFYSPNQPSYSGGGSNSDGVAGSNSVQGVSNMPSEFYNWVASQPGSPLVPMPVSLMYFKVTDITSEGVTLVWATATELNFDHFNLQRSSNGKNFETIATVQGHGTTREEHNYSFVDKFPISGTSYYRLQSIDFDGYTETFNVVAANVESGKTAALYPVPVTDSNLSIKLNFVPLKEIFVVITDLSGLEVLRAEVATGETSISLPVAVNPGFYVVRINSSEINKVVKILVK